MRRVFSCLVFLTVLAGGAGPLLAQGEAKLSDAEKKQVNEWLAERAKTMVSAHKLESEINQAWSDTKYSTPEIEALRARYRELGQELLRTQEALQKKVQEVPAVREKRQQLDAEKNKIQDLSKKVAEKTGGAH